MKNYFLKGSFFLILLVLLSSCVSKKKVVYFQETEGVSLNKEVANYEPTIQVGDILSIHVSGVDAEATIPFNLYESPVSMNSYNSNARPIPYLVDAEGEINFPVLGELKVANFTTRELTTSLTKKLESYIKNPNVNIRIKNFKVTILGAVKSPGSYPIENERITIVEALGLAGDLDDQGVRNDVTLIREQNGERTMVKVDLTNQELFNSPYYYLAQNDVLYVAPNKAKVNSSGVGASTSIILSAASLLVSFFAVFIK